MGALPPDVAGLVQRAQAGETAAFTELVSRFRDAAYGLAYHELGNPEDAQDAAQEAFVQAYLHLGELRDPGRFGPWLRQITANVCRQWRRRAAPTVPLAEEIAAEGRPEEDVERLGVRLVVRRALARLSPPSRLTVTLAYVNGYSHDEIAHFLDLPLNTVRSRLHRAKQQLREEMAEMVSDMLHGDKPDEQFDEQVVREAMKRGWEAYQSHRRGEAAGHYDQALAMLDRLPATPEATRMRVEALHMQSAVDWDWDRSLRLSEQALMAARLAGDRQLQAEALVILGSEYSNHQDQARAVARYQEALTIYRELGDRQGEGRALFWLGCRALERDDLPEVMALMQGSLDSLESIHDYAMAGCARAALDLFAELGPDRLGKALPEQGGVISRNFRCIVLEVKNGAVRFAQEPGYGNGPSPAADPLAVHDVLWWVSPLGTFLDPAVPVGGSWSGPSSSYAKEPLHSTMSVLSSTERVTVPAGTFDGCLLMELQTDPPAAPGDDERAKRLNTIYYHGTRRLWFAPGVGLVQVQVVRGDGLERLTVLQECAIAGGEGWFPLAIGNRWRYRCGNPPEPALYCFDDHAWNCGCGKGVPVKLTDSEVYQVHANEGSSWFLSAYHYVYIEPAGGELHP